MEGQSAERLVLDLLRRSHGILLSWNSVGASFMAKDVSLSLPAIIAILASRNLAAESLISFLYRYDANCLCLCKHNQLVEQDEDLRFLRSPLFIRPRKLFTVLLAVIRGRAVVETEYRIEVDVLKLSNSRNAHDISGRIRIGFEFGFGVLRRLKKIPNRCIYRRVENTVSHCTHPHSNESVKRPWAVLS